MMFTEKTIIVPGHSVVIFYALNSFVHQEIDSFALLSNIQIYIKPQLVG